jgi:hypothetical protein
MPTWIRAIWRNMPIARFLGGDFHLETGTPDDGDLDGTTLPIDLNGKGGTRTLDPGIMRKKLAGKAS